MVELLGDLVDLAPHLGCDVRLDEVVDLVQPGELSDFLIAERDLRMNQELLRKFDDRPVCAADMLARPRLAFGDLTRLG